MYIVLGDRITLHQIVNLKLFVMKQEKKTVRKTLRGSRETFDWIENEVIRIKAIIEIIEQMNNEPNPDQKDDTLRDYKTRLIAMQDVANYLQKF